MQAKILKENSLNKFNALKTTTQCLERQTFTNCQLFQRSFSHLFHTDVRTFKYELSKNMNNLEKKLNNDILHEKDSKSALTRQDFKDYTQIEAQFFKDLIIQHMESIELCIVERARHEQEIQNRLKRLNERKLQIQECMVQKVNASDASSEEKDYSTIVSDKGNDQGLENQSNTSRMKAAGQGMNAMIKALLGMIRTSDIPMTRNQWLSNVIPDSPDMCDNEIQIDQNAVEYDDERVALANLIANLKLDVDENKKIQKQLKKVNASLTQELTECKSILAETSRTLRESNS
ncbi:hypothetical protein Tco_0049771, partial [Tanacetum coccineum]